MARKPDSHHVLPLFCDDLIASCVDMTPACFGAYMRLLCYAWTRGGIPDDEAACARITGGMEPGDWSAIRSRLLVLDDGRLTHQRLELERVAVSEIREKRAEAGRMGGRPKANGKQNESKTKASDKQSESKTKAPNPSPSLPSSGNTHTPPDGGNEFRKPGWAADAWAEFVAKWNATDRAAKWEPLTAPAGWVDHAANPGWLERAQQALARLPACKFFENPLAVTKFFEFVDRILAGEFDNQPRRHGRTSTSPDDAERKAALERKAAEFAGYRPAPYRRPKELAGLAHDKKLTEEDL
jgi:uncharacterized protein YdaU (DUF1376 family)